ncbi:GGDEF domain-containing protein [Vibrio rumoiensis]|uniref:diguanylate cyclase n=1 Tax=Vibrio rumoiensis TaxID=76258 RepID=A0ABW7IWK1_9VIBR|nr:sensor domain-containing diguanylate cyclase [Vibrio rumoiensis]
MTTAMNEYQHILEIHPNPCVIHIDFKPLYANDAFARFSGLKSADQILDMESLMVLINPEEREDARVRYKQAFAKQQTEPKVIAHTDLLGNPVMVEIIDKLINWKGQKALCTFISIVTDTVNKQRRLKKLAEQDPLTQLHNRRYIIDKITQLHHNGIAKEFFIAIVDIDYFKKVNDTYGHLAGDKTLQQFAELLQGFVGVNDYLARLGGEEFILLIRSNSIQQVMARLESLRASIENNHFIIPVKENVEPLRIRCTVSMGVTQIQQDEKIDLSYVRADEALYLAKHQGRNQIIVKD